MDKKINEAINILKQGGVVVFPTDTAFGIGCRIDNEEAIRRLFEIRKRPKNQPPPVLVDSLRTARAYAEIPEDVEEKLIKKYWPGALTIILQSRIDKIPRLVKGKGVTLGIRMPNHPITLALIKGVGVPILGPSANFHGEKTPYEFVDLDKKLIALVDYVIPGKCALKKQSTVVDCSGKAWKILREGAVKIVNIPSARLGADKKTILSIDTSSNQEIAVSLITNGKRYEERKRIDRKAAQVVLPMIETLLIKHKVNLEDLNGVKVNVGQGSFTGIRVGVTIANALSFLLKIPINGKKLGEFVEPKYQ